MDTCSNSTPDSGNAPVIDPPTSVADTHPAGDPSTSTTDAPVIDPPASGTNVHAAIDSGSELVT